MPLLFLQEEPAHQVGTLTSQLISNQQEHVEADKASKRVRAQTQRDDAKAKKRQAEEAADGSNKEQQQKKKKQKKTKHCSGEASAAAAGAAKTKATGAGDIGRVGRGGRVITKPNRDVPIPLTQQLN